MKKLIKFGEDVEGYNIPVLNEREIRAAAGMLFLATFISLMFILFKGNFVPIKYVITLFLVDFMIRVFINPRFSPTLIFARFIVRKQTPEYVGAPQKKFAWIIGVVLSAAMFFFFIIVNAYSPITGIICLICLYSCSLNRLLEFVWAACFIHCFLKRKFSYALATYAK